MIFPMTSILPLGLLVRPALDDPRPLVIYHGRNCPDGFAAALAAWLFYQGRAEFLALDHGEVKAVEQLPDLVGRAVYILDFSFAPALLRAIEDRAAKLVLLDHHKSAADTLQGYDCRCGVVHFDMKKSGSRLAWDFFLPDQPLPDLVRCVEDRDLWTWQYPESPGFLAALDMEPLEFEHWQKLIALSPADFETYVARGRAMDEKFSKLAADMAESAQPVQLNGQAGLMANVPGAFHSLVGELLSRQSGTFALLWNVDKNGAVKVGLRSQRGYNCIPLAESFGGGGHAQACGMRLPVARLPELLSGTLNAKPERPQFSANGDQT
jgi:hypothetical protein